jgi:hypothetical protein
MDSATAELLFGLIFAGMSAVWLISLVRLIKLGRPEQVYRRDRFDHEPDSEDEPDSRNQTILKTSVPGMFTSLFEVTERTSERVSVRKTGPLICNQPSGMYFSDADFHITPDGPGHVRVIYELKFGRLLKRIRGIGLFLVLGVGLPALLIVGSVVWFIVVNHADPSVRWQVMQTLQIAHALWPPFLLLYIYRSGRRHGRTFVSNILSSLEIATARISREQMG